MDRPDILDPACRIVLTDFGAACRLERPGERLSSVVGTRKFSPPEFFDRNYGAKVDVWALGIVMYGLATGRFPFRNEMDVRNKAIFIPRTVYPLFADFIMRMLVKDESTRLDSDQAMNHQYLNPGRGAAQESATPAALARPEQGPAEEVLRVDTPRSRAEKALGCGKSLDASTASTAEPLSGSDSSPKERSPATPRSDRCSSPPRSCRRRSRPRPPSPAPRSGGRCGRAVGARRRRAAGPRPGPPRRPAACRAACSA
ncbi:unnamed protein product [Prorocentrum cordatum]|uniref:non-specific serine/threonine protein kinase n=1 Tax=Prorocentrum cordatum TaxID=2364126 RepID=A0ABN9UN62_9DINO|nr:unnamed protein product [Polarella glacialis]